MKSRVSFVILITAIVLVIAPNIFSQKAMPGVPQFNVQQEVRLSGQIREVKDFACPVTGAVGTHLELQTTQGAIEVHVAAAHFLQQYGIRFDAGQRVEMIGVKGVFEGRPAFLPRIIMVGNDTYYLRDKDGKPVW